MRLLSAKWSTSKSNCYLSAASQVVDTLTIHRRTFSTLLVAYGVGSSKGKTAPRLPATSLDTLCQKAHQGSWERGSCALTGAPYCKNQVAGGRIKNQQIKEWLGLEGTLKGHVAQPPCHGQGHFNKIRLLRAPSSLTLRVSRDGASTTSLGNLSQCFVTLTVKNSPLYLIWIKLLSLKPIPLSYRLY